MKPSGINGKNKKANPPKCLRAVWVGSRFVPRSSLRGFHKDFLCVHQAVPTNVVILRPRRRICAQLEDDLVSQKVLFSLTTHL
jgi:hypothetical protein